MNETVQESPKEGNTSETITHESSCHLWHGSRVVILKIEKSQ